MKDKFLVPIAYFIVCFFWGSSWLAIKLSLDYIPPFFSASIRFIFAAVLIHIIMKVFAFEFRLDKKSLRIYLIMGLFSFSIPFALVYWSEKFIPSSLASILFGMYPFMVAIFSALFLKSEKLTFKKVLGISLAFFGLIVIFSEGIKFEFSTYLFGMLAVVLSASMQALVAVYLKKNAKELNPMSMNLVPLYMSAILLFIFGLIFEGIQNVHLEFTPILYILYLSIFATILTFTSYYWLLKRVNVVVLSLTSFITPIFAILFGWLLNDEKLSFNTFLGSFLILIGILIVNVKFQKTIQELNEKPIENK